MNAGRRWIHLSLLLALLLGVAWRPAAARPGDQQANRQLYFPETGHWIIGEFLETYQRVSDPVRIFGYPITDEFQEQATGRTVQYFERARFELFPEDPPELRVHISPLGQYLYQPGKSLTVPENFPACRFFAETRFQVCYAFLDFFNQHGGAAQFGYPISNFEIHDQLIVQYFQRARFEWHPELPPGQRVLLTDLGKLYFDAAGENPFLLLARSNERIPRAILTLKVRAFPGKAVLPASTSQSIYVVVQDQNLLPVSNAQVTLIISYPGGEETRILVPTRSDPNGLLRYTFPFQDQPPGLVKVLVEVVYENLESQTLTSFRIWY